MDTTFGQVLSKYPCLEKRFQRVSETAEAKASPVGNLPPDGLFPHELTEIDRAGYLEDAAEMKKYFSIFDSKMPTELLDELEQLQKRLS